MSNWLKSVNNLLHQLDDTVENVAEDRALTVQPGQGKDAVDSILAKRGLAAEEEEEEEEEKIEAQETEDFDDVDVDEDGWDDLDVPIEENAEKNMGTESEASAGVDKEETEEETPSSEDSSEEIIEFEQAEPDQPNQAEEAVDNPEEHDEPGVAKAKTNVLEGDELKPDDNVVEEIIHEDATETQAKPNEPVEGAEPTPSDSTKTAVPPTSRPHVASGSKTSPNPVKAPPPAPPVPVKTFEKEYKQAVAREKEAQREARTLRRHVVTLNSELEAAESELGPLREELERAGVRLEKDRKRHKDETEAVKKRHVEEIAALKQQQIQTTKGIQARSNGQLEEMRKQVRELEEKRAQEGGDWSKEIENTMQRELETSRKLALLEDEKSTLLAQISTLQAQCDRTQNRLDSLSQTADNAMHREREAEDKLDQALSLHARQLSQRQTREAELERAIADLSAALTTAQKGGGGFSKSGNGDQESSIKEELNSTREELETTKIQLEAQEERVKMMQQELKDMSKERNAETSATRSKQLQFDRQAAEMSLQISRLQASLREAQRGPDDSMGGTEDDHTPAGQVNELTREVVRLQGRLGQSGSEVKALKSRLQVAVERAEKAEKALSDVGDIETAPVGDEGIRRRRRRGDNYGSIRSSLQLNNVQDENAKRIGKAIDVIDRFSVDTGKYLRYNPLARGGFILYLAFLHFWTFAVLFFHTHRFETVHGDFGAKYPHGPHAMMHHVHPIDPKDRMQSSDTASVDAAAAKRILETGEVTGDEEANDQNEAAEHGEDRDEDHENEE